MIVMSGLLAPADVSIAVMGILINTSGGAGHGRHHIGWVRRVRVCRFMPSTWTEAWKGRPASALPLTSSTCPCLPTIPAGIIFMGVTGFSMAASTRVSNSLGAGCPRTARRAIWTALAMTSTLQLCSMAGIVLLRHRWALLFTGACAPAGSGAAAATVVLAVSPVLVARMCPRLSGGMRCP